MRIPPLPATFTRFAVAQCSVRVGEAVAVAALVAFAIRAYYGSHLLEFGDESEKFVALSMILRGDRLYRDIVATHGPLAYLLAWGTSIIFGTTDFVYARLSNVVLALLATAAIATSPLVVRNRVASCWASALFLAPLSALWIMQTLHMVIYHAHIAFLTTIILAQLVWPAVAGLRVSRGLL